MIDLFKNIDQNWTIFLDRDGVINQRPYNDYVKKWGDFVFLPGATEAISRLSMLFKRIIIVTNQQGVGKGLMTKDEVEGIHGKMTAEIHNKGGRIDAVYYCPDLANKPLNCRKPSTHMAQKAIAEFPDIQLDKSIMLGDTQSDMEFGRNAGMHTVYINQNHQEIDKTLFDASFSGLIDFTNHLDAID